VPFLPSPEESAAAAREFLAQGFHAVKLKVGRGIAVDMPHVEAVRGALGARELRLDVNCAYDVATSIEFARALKPLDIAWLEEPIRPDDPAALAEIRRAASMPIAAGENEFTLAAFEAFARAGAVDVLMPNIARAGGVSGLVAVGEVCQRHGVGLSPHGVGAAVSVAAALHACRAIPAFTIYEANRLPNPLRDDLARPRLALEDGRLVARDAPGHGVELDWALAETYRLAPAAAPAPGHARARA
jgi:L-alanine-DL-glutamate epimerase-like enolase superfamily enzyme